MGSADVVSILEGTRSESWNKRRWDWLRAVSQEANLSPIARLTAYVLVTQFANSQTANCSPGVMKIAVAVATSKDTMKRALRALAAGGWIDRGDDFSRGEHMTITFRFPENKGGRNALQAGCKNEPQEGGKTAPPGGAFLSDKGCIFPAPPTPPYKDKPNTNQSARPKRPETPNAFCAKEGGFESEEWDRWLEERSYPKLQALGMEIRSPNGGAFVVPYRIPPVDDVVAVRIAEKWASWALGGVCQ